MRRPWTVRRAKAAGVSALAGILLLGGCGDPDSGAEAAPPAPSLARPRTTQQHAPASPRETVEAPSVLYLGDSLATENQKVLGGLLRGELGARYTSAPYSGTTLCDYLEGTGKNSLVPPRDKAAALVRRLRPDIVVLQFWGNAWYFTPCMGKITYDSRRSRYLSRYTADARQLTEQIKRAGAKRVMWVLQGPDPITPDRIRRVNGIYEKQAAASGDLLADAGKAVSPAGARYTWSQYLPCTTDEREHDGYCTQPGNGRTALHLDKDYLHFCLAPATSKPRPCPVRSPGILRMARAITDAIGARVR